MEKKSSMRCLPLPLDIKILDLQMAVYTNIIEWGKRTQKEFQKTVAFINPNEYNSKTIVWKKLGITRLLRMRFLIDALMITETSNGIVNHFGAVCDVVVGL